jgi:hypothetical protein
MTASLSSSSAATAQPAPAGVDARPQVQSRRVSLKLGPLGITYSTDQVLWTEAVAAAGISASAAHGAIEGAEAKTPVTPAAALAPPERDNAGQQDQQAQQARQAHEAQAAGRTFTLELAQAWRRQVEEKVRSEQTYDRSGLARAGSRSNAAAQEVQGASDLSADAATPAATGTPASASVEAAGGLGAEQQTRPPASRMRQAIGAYLACARSFNAVAPMLTAVA